MQYEPIRAKLVSRLHTLRTTQRTSNGGQRFLTSHEAGQIVEALWRLDAGQYGQCADCNQPIEAARLNRVLWAVQCGQCQPEQLAAA